MCLNLNITFNITALFGVLSKNTKLCWSCIREEALWLISISNTVCVFLSVEDSGESEDWERPAEDGRSVPLSISRTLKLPLPVLRPHCSGEFITSTVGSHAHAQELQQRAEWGEHLRYSSVEDMLTM